MNRFVLFFSIIGMALLLISCNNTIKEYWDNGNIKTKVNYLNSEKTEYEYCEYYDNGKLKIEAKYCNGLLEGEYLQYFRNGQLKLMRHYLNGAIKGIEQVFNNAGEIQYQREYKDAHIIKEQDYRVKYKAIIN